MHKDNKACVTASLPLWAVAIALVVACAPEDETTPQKEVSVGVQHAESFGTHHYALENADGSLDLFLGKDVRRAVESGKVSEDPPTVPYERIHVGVKAASALRNQDDPLTLSFCNPKNDFFLELVAFHPGYGGLHRETFVPGTPGVYGVIQIVRMNGGIVGGYNFDQVHDGPNGSYGVSSYRAGGWHDASPEDDAAAGCRL